MNTLIASLVALFPSFHAADYHLASIQHDWNARCARASGNWVNAAKVSCPDSGSNTGFKANPKDHSKNTDTND